MLILETTLNMIPHGPCQFKQQYRGEKNYVYINYLNNYFTSMVIVLGNLSLVFEVLLEKPNSSFIGVRLVNRIIKVLGVLLNYFNTENIDVIVIWTANTKVMMKYIKIKSCPKSINCFSLLLWCFMVHSCFTHIQI